MTMKCNMTWDTFNGDIPETLVYFFLIYCCTISIFGTICNVVALWCVVSCPRTNTSVKVLLCALFSTTLLMCLVVMPFMAHVSLAKLWCDREVPRPVLRIVILSYINLTQIELFYIFVMALLRALAVWAPQRSHLRLGTALAVTVGIGLYNSFMTTLLAFWRHIITKAARYPLLKVYNVVHFVLPLLLTLACYLSTIVAVRRNKRNLAASQHGAAVTHVMDDATRAMLAVFISNLLLGLPHSIYHILPLDYKVFSYVIMHSVFFTHLFVDPLVFMCFNQHHRRRILQVFRLTVGRFNHKDTSTLSSHAIQSSFAVKSSEEGQGKISITQE